MERVSDRQGKMERYCSTGQSPQQAVAPTEEEEAHLNKLLFLCFYAAQLLRTAQSKRYTKSGASLLENRNRDGFQNVMLLYKSDNGQRPKNRLCQLISVMLCSLFLDFLTFEDGDDWLSQNVGKELPIYAA